MKIFLHGYANKRGIYKITNTKNGRYYYGSASRLKERAYSHRDDLRRNRHANLFLQRDYNKCGEDAFIFEAIETVDGAREEQLAKEQAYLDKFFDGGNECYNLCPKAESREGSKNVRPFNPETDGRVTSRTPEVCAIVSKKNKKTWNTPKKKEEALKNAQKRWDNHSADVTVTNKKTGETVTIEGSVRSWCQERNLSYKSFHLMLKGKTKSSGGWFLGTEEPTYVERKGEKRKPLSDEHRAKIAGGKYAGVVLKNKVSGEMFVVGENAKADCRERGISYSSFAKMMSGKCKSASGWIV